MLCKVLKHDFISTGRIMGVIYLIVAGISGVTLISHYAKGGDSMTVAEALGVAILLMVTACMFVLTAVVVLTDFHKTLYAEQGYLTFTLPVKSWMILLSKIIVSTVWFVIALAALFGSMWITGIVFKKEVLGDNYDLIMSMLSQFSNVSVTSIIVSVVVRIIMYFIQFAFFTVTVFFTSTIANTRLFQKRSVLWTIVLFIPISVIATKIAGFIDDHIVFSLFYIDGRLQLVTNNLKYAQLELAGNAPIDIASLFVYLALGIGLFFATHYLMSKKVNIR